jgi:hypothetical protein
MTEIYAPSLSLQLHTDVLRYGEAWGGFKDFYALRLCNREKSQKEGMESELRDQKLAFKALKY